MEDRTNLNVNPIRKVVVMLQNMQKKIAAESDKKEKMYDQYMCYCENADGTLGKSISDAETKIPQLESSISEGAALKKQLKAELKEAQVSRVEAKDAIATTQMAPLASPSQMQRPRSPRWSLPSKRGQP
jgi:chromosome segregation ATPase